MKTHAGKNEKMLHVLSVSACVCVFVSVLCVWHMWKALLNGK